MKDKILEHSEVLVTRYPVLEAVKGEIIAAYQIIEESYKNGGKLLVAGNGGSAADEKYFSLLISLADCMVKKQECKIYKMNITVRQSRQSGVARATCPD